MAAGDVGHRIREAGVFAARKAGVFEAHGVALGDRLDPHAAARNEEAHEQTAEDQ